ncbi:MAG: hypothetical protein ACT4QC_12725 [Planctomycetaceae bacterium]
MPLLPNRSFDFLEICRRRACLSTRQLRTTRERCRSTAWPIAAEILETRALLSAPTLDWGVSLGSSTGSASINSTAVDSSGDVYVAGVVTSGTVDVDPGAGTANVTADNQTGFVAKYDPDGNFLWVETFSSDKTVTPFSLTVDATTGVYVVGGFEGTTRFGIGESHPATLVNEGGNDPNGFVTKLDQATGDVVWVDGILGERALATTNVAVDGSGNVYIAGQAGSGTVTIINGETGATLDTFSNTASNYIAKLGTDGSVTWAQGFAEGKATVTAGSGLAVDGSGNVYLAGTLFGKDVDFDPGSGSFELSRTGWGSDAFVTKLDTDGEFLWTTKDDSKGLLGTAASSLAVDASGHAYITIQRGGDFWSPWWWHSACGGKQQLAKIDSSGDWQWTETLARTRPDYGFGCWPFWGFGCHESHDVPSCLASDPHDWQHADSPPWVPPFDDNNNWAQHDAAWSGGWSGDHSTISLKVSNTTAKVALNSAGNPVVVSARSGATEYDSSGNKVWTTSTPLPVTDVATGPAGAIVFVGLFRGELNVSPDDTFTIDSNTSWWQQAPFIVKWTES